MVKTRAQHLKKLQEQKIAESWDRLEGARGVLVDILSRVSVKSIPIFKTVSKYWHGSISNKYFAKQQIMQSSKNPLFIACPVMNSKMEVYSMKAGRFELSHLNTIQSMYMIASFNGLICCVNRICDKDVESKFCDLQIWICNPCTGETLLLPQGTPSFEFEPSVGVAYGSDLSDYKVFRIYGVGKKVLEERELAEGSDFYARNGHALSFACEVYSSNTASWTKIDTTVPCVPMYGIQPYRCGHVFVGNKIYWLSSLDEPGEILSVDLAGNFDVIKLPEYKEILPEDEKITESTHLLILKGSLALLVLHAGYLEIWKKVDSEDNWLVEHAVEMKIKDIELLLAVTSVKNYILFVTNTHWRTYDVDSGVWDKRRAPHTGFVNPAVFPFTESVLPCNGGVRL